MEPVVSEHDYCDAPRVSGLSEFKKMTVTYIAGFVVRVVQKKLACKTCKGALLSSDVNGSSLESPCLLNRKNRGGLTIPSPGVEFVCHESELIFNRMMEATAGALPDF